MKSLLSAPASSAAGEQSSAKQLCLVPLRDVRIVSAVLPQIPSRLGELVHLESLKVRQSRVQNLPSSMGNMVANGSKRFWPTVTLHRQFSKVAKLAERQVLSQVAFVASSCLISQLLSLHLLFAGEHSVILSGVGEMTAVRQTASRFCQMPS